MYQALFPSTSVVQGAYDTTQKQNCQKQPKFFIQDFKFIVGFFPFAIKVGEFYDLIY